MNTGGKYDSLKKSVGLNGVGTKQSMRYLIIFEWSRFVMTSKSSRILSRNLVLEEIIDTTKERN
jgi:hypothetical protein